MTSRAISRAVASATGRSSGLPVFGGPTLQFTFDTPDASGEMQMMGVGTGTPVHTHTADILQPQAPEVGDYYQTFGANVAVWRGARLDGATPYGTDGSGDPLAQTPYLWYQPGPRTNILDYSNDYTNAAWREQGNIATLGAADATGLDGTTSATTIVDDGSGGTGLAYFVRTVTLATSTKHTWSKIAKKSGLSWLAMEVRLWTTPGGSPAAWFNLDTCSVGTVEAGIDAGIEDLGGGFCRCSISFTTDATDDTGDIQSWIAAADNSFTVDLDGTSSIILDNDELIANGIEEITGLGPIYNNTSTDKTVYEYAEANHETENGVYFFELYMTQGDGAITNPTDANARLISFGTDGYIGVTAADGKLSANDGTNAAASDAAVPAGASKCALVYSAVDSKMQLYVDGDWGPEATFSGDMSINADIELGRLTDFCFGLANGKHYSGISSLAAGKTLVEGLAA